MDSFGFQGKIDRDFWAFLVVGLLFFSIALHTLSLSHRHPAFLGEGTQALTHGEDKKFLAILAAMFVLALVEDVFGRDIRVDFSANVLLAKGFQQDILKLFNYLLNFSRRGLLEPRPV